MDRKALLDALSWTYEGVFSGQSTKQNSK